MFAQRCMYHKFLVSQQAAGCCYVSRVAVGSPAFVSFIATRRIHSTTKNNPTPINKHPNLMTQWKPTSPTWIDSNTKVICQGFTGKQVSIICSKFMKNLKRFRLLVCQADDLPAVDLLVP
jgi:hypothetical protein